MTNWLVLVHDVYTGSVVRQFVTAAETAEEAVAKFTHLMADGTEHGIAIPTGSEPGPEPEPVVPEVVPAETPPPVSETTASPDTAVVTPAAEDEAAALVADELKSLPAHVLERVKALLAGN